MEKKTYMTPSVKVVQLDSGALLVISGDVNDGTIDGYQKDGYNDYIGGDGNGGFGSGDPD